MRKFQVLIWAQEASPAFFARLREQALALSSTDGVSAVQLNLADSDVEPAADKRMANGDSPLFDALCSFCCKKRIFKNYGTRVTRGREN